jgi:hypothetical protein
LRFAHRLLGALDRAGRSARLLHCHSNPIIAGLEPAIHGTAVMKGAGGTSDRAWLVCVDEIR